MRDAGKTVIFSTHVMEQAEKLCDYILLINKGETVVDGTLEAIRSRYETGAVMLDIEGDTDFIADLPMVKRVARSGKRIEVLLQENADDQDLLKALVGRVRVNVFEVKVPTLHEMFVSLVGRHDP